MQLSRDAFVDAMRITYPDRGGHHRLRRVHRLAVPPAHGHDEFASAEEEKEAQEISEYEILGA